MSYQKSIRSESAPAPLPDIPCPPAVRALLDLFTAHGESAYLVGGCVRDALMGKAPHDWDVAVTTVPADTEAICASAEVLRDNWKETQDWLHGRRKGFAFTYVISTADPYKHVGGVRSLAIPDAVGPESYSCFGRGNGFLLQKFRDGEARPAMAEFYNWYCPSNEHALRGFWQNAIHGKCFYNFALHQIFGQPSWYYRWSWEPGRWEKAQEVFRRVRAHEDLYAVSPSAASASSNVRVPSLSVPLKFFVVCVTHVPGKRVVVFRDIQRLLSAIPSMSHVSTRKTVSGPRESM